MIINDVYDSEELELKINKDILTVYNTLLNNSEDKTIKPFDIASKQERKEAIYNKYKNIDTIDVFNEVFQRNTKEQYSKLNNKIPTSIFEEYEAYNVKKEDALYSYSNLSKTVFLNDLLATYKEESLCIDYFQEEHIHYLEEYLKLKDTSINDFVSFMKFNLYIGFNTLQELTFRQFCTIYNKIPIKDASYIKTTYPTLFNSNQIINYIENNVYIKLFFNKFLFENYQFEETFYTYNINNDNNENNSKKITIFKQNIILNHIPYLVKEHIFYYIYYIIYSINIEKEEDILKLVDMLEHAKKENELLYSLMLHMMKMIQYTNINQIQKPIFTELITYLGNKDKLEILESIVLDYEDRFEPMEEIQMLSSVYMPSIIQYLIEPSLKTILIAYKWGYKDALYTNTKHIKDNPIFIEYLHEEESNGFLLCGSDELYKEKLELKKNNETKVKRVYKRVHVDDIMEIYKYIIFNVDIVETKEHEIPLIVATIRKVVIKYPELVSYLSHHFFKNVSTLKIDEVILKEAKNKNKKYKDDNERQLGIKKAIYKAKMYSIIFDAALLSNPLSISLIENINQDLQKELIEKYSKHIVLLFKSPIPSLLCFYIVDCDTKEERKKNEELVFSLFPNRIIREMGNERLISMLDDYQYRKKYYYYINDV
jgi:hypothetical protein